ncbi:MAG: hypothetical protein A2428_07695 [Bdellovibrionales bacterium RIFOXYC1_FULL_54_43]|nr:MAG: hypothetical protein A2428_07695 [Bdellovibrionales bacterium RIFOXYC1_FULL_54_43]
MRGPMSGMVWNRTAMAQSLCALSLLVFGGLVLVDGSANASLYWGDDSARLVQWCRGSLGILANYSNRSRLQLVDGKWDEARAVLREGLNQALVQSEGVNSLTRRALRRGIEVSDSIERNRIEDIHGLEASVEFLSQYYDFMIKIVGPLDTNYFLPYQYGPRRVGLEAEYERSYHQFAERQLTWFVETFSMTTPHYGVVAKYSAKSYLKILEYLARGTAEELDSSLWRARYACAIEQLEELHLRVKNFNDGYHEEYSSERRAVNSATGEFLQILNALRGDCRR